jgi:hypothetical protein
MNAASGECGAQSPTHGRHQNRIRGFHESSLKCGSHRILAQSLFSDEARADIRAIDRDTALRLIKALARFLVADGGDVKQLRGVDPPRYRFRIGAREGISAADIDRMSKINPARTLGLE